MVPTAKVICTVFAALVTSGYLVGPAYAQIADSGRTTDGVYIDFNRSDRKLRRDVIVRGNNVELYVRNWGFLGQPVTGPGGGIWPRGTEHDHLHSLSPFMAAEVNAAGGNRIVVISEGYEPDHKTDPITNIDQKFQPVPGYLNDRQGQNELANQLNPDSWPSRWPGKDSRWSGYWNGYFGLNQKNADQEAYHVMDDAWNNKYPFYPCNDVTGSGLPTASDTTRRGLGLQIEVRIFQWSHPLAQDVVFAHYQVSNIGNYSYNTTTDPVYFGVYSDFNAGGLGAVDDNASFDQSQNLVYCWDNDNRGVWTKFREIPPGYMAYKFLESPGISDDGIDNDGDGVIDERRDNDAGAWVFTACGKYSNYQLKWHWSGDEDGDWNPITDDKGTDGIGPDEEGYPGPDPDGSEADGKPEQGEPNFGKTDKDESDQIGLTSFTAPNYGTIHITDELNFWPLIQKGYFRNPPLTANQMWLFGSGPFKLPPAPAAGWTQRYSVCFVFGADRDAIYREAGVAQRIYDSDYRFAKPPRQPKLQAVAGDSKVTLMWDAKSELSWDAIYHFDFEGYKIYKSTEPQFLEPTIITDAYGNKTFKQPAAQFDLIDSLTGMHPLQLGEEIGVPQGIHYFMGTDNGLQHHWIDTAVVNGRTYYYALVAYDKGYVSEFYQRGLSDSPYLLQITPSECPGSIALDGGVITHMDPNTAYATPSPKSSNYVKGTSDGDTSVAHTTGFASGRVTTTVLAPELLKNRKFIISFTDTLANQVDQSGLQVEIQTRTYSIYDSTNRAFVRKNVPLPRTPPRDSIMLGIKVWKEELFDQGVVINFANTIAAEKYIQDHSSWDRRLTNTSVVTLRLEATYAPLLPMNVAIEFGDTAEVLDTAYTAPNAVNPRSRRPVNFKVYEPGTNQRVRVVFVENPAATNGRIDTPGEYLIISIWQPGSLFLTPTWRVTFGASADTHSVPFVAPVKGERYIVRPGIPFSSKDVFEFNTTASIVEIRATASVLDRIMVVPNPYIETAIWEKQSFLRGRGERKINFNNVPVNCTLRIYTLNGLLIKELRHDGSTGGVGTITWDLTTKDGLEVASGLYIYHVEAEGIGTKIGKFAIVN